MGGSISKVKTKKGQLQGRNSRFMQGRDEASLARGDEQSDLSQLHCRGHQDFLPRRPSVQERQKPHKLLQEPAGMAFRESLKSRQSQQGVPLSEARSSRVWQEQSRINASHKANTGQRLPVPSFRDKLSMLSSKSDRPKTFDQSTSCFDPFSKHKQDLQQRLYARLRGNEAEMPDYCKQIESQRQNLHSKFFEDRHFQNETVTRDIQGIEDFVDELGRKHNYSSMKEWDAKAPRETRKISSMQKKFSKMMESHPFDKFMDRSLVESEQAKRTDDASFGDVAKAWTWKHYGSVEELVKEKADYLRFSDFKNPGEPQAKQPQRRESDSGGSETG